MYTFISTIRSGGQVGIAGLLFWALLSTVLSNVQATHPTAKQPVDSLETGSSGASQPNTATLQEARTILQTDPRAEASESDRPTSEAASEAAATWAHPLPPAANPNDYIHYRLLESRDFIPPQPRQEGALRPQPSPVQEASAAADGSSPASHAPPVFEYGDYGLLDSQTLSEPSGRRATYEGEEELDLEANVTYRAIGSKALMDVISPKLVRPKIAHFFEKYYKIRIGYYDSPDLYEFIRRWHRTPYVWGGISKWGVDCSGFIKILQDSLYNREMPRVAGHQYKVCQRVEKPDLQEGDLVFFIKGNSYIFHVGLYLKDNKFVHASSGGGVVISKLDEPYWQRYFYCGGRPAVEKLQAYHKKW